MGRVGIECFQLFMQRGCSKLMGGAGIQYLPVFMQRGCGMPMGMFGISVSQCLCREGVAC